MNQFKQKIVSVILVTIGAYFGFQSLDLILDIYQVETYFSVAWYIYAFHVFWLAFIFDLHLKTGGHFKSAREKHSGLALLGKALATRIKHFYSWEYVRHFLNYLILPSILYWSVIVLMYLNPFFALFKDGLIIVTTAAMSVAYWYFKDFFSKQMEAHETGIKFLLLVKLYAAYLAYTSLIAVGWYFGLELSFLMPLAFVFTSLVVYQALFQHKMLNARILPGILMIAVMMTLVFAIVYLNWKTNYYTAGLLVVAVYNTVWGIMHKYIDRALTWRIFWEYVFMLVVLLSFILATHDYQGQI